MADKWILAYYATADQGGITRLNTAKILFNSPLTIIGMAAGAASLPFFSALYAQGRMYDFDGAVTRAVTRLLAASMVVSAWMIALAGPIVDLLRGGSFSRGDAGLTARYFAVFAVTLGLWSAQGIYARAFYAAGNTLTPAISGTVVTLATIPVYAWMYGRFGVDGLAWASDVGIAVLTVVLAVQLHRKRLVSVASLGGGELARAGLAAALGYSVTAACVRWLPRPAGHSGDVGVIVGASLVWLAVTLGVLLGTGSKLPGQVWQRRSVG